MFTAARKPRLAQFPLLCIARNSHHVVSSKHHGLRWEQQIWNKPPEEKKNTSGRRDGVRFTVQAQAELNCAIGGYNCAITRHNENACQW